MARRDRRDRLTGIVLVVTAACLALAGTAAAAAPTAITGAVTAFGPTSATVSGTINPGGQATTWRVEYGPDSKYGSTTPSQNAGSGTANAAVSVTIDGLSPKTTYHYRFLATNGTGTAQGADGLFTTAAADPPDVVTGAANGVSGTSATLNGTVDPNGRPSTWYFEYGPDTKYGSKTPEQNAGSGTTATAVSAPVTGLKPGTTYHFRLVAKSDAGTTTGGDQAFSLGSAPGATTSSATAVSSSAATLRGSVDPGGQSTSWHFEYGTSTAYGSSTATRDAGSGTRSVSVTEALTSLAVGTTYHFRLVATNASGTTTGADRTFATSSTGPPAATTGAAQGVGSTGATLTGTLDPRGRSTSWYFEYGTSTRYGSRTSTRTDSGTGARGVSAAVSRLTAGATYHFRLVASSSSGTTRGADASFRTAGAAVTINRPALLTTYGRAVTLSGSVAGGASGVSVQVLGQAFGEPSFRSIATVRTGAGGTWTYSARPSIRTSYQATANGATSASVTVAVRPAVSLSVLRGARLWTHVSGRSSFAGRFVQLQRLSGGRWVTVRRVRLNAGSSATFHARVLPRGRSTIRIAMSVNQAGAGYLAGFSRTLAYDRR